MFHSTGRAGVFVSGPLWYFRVVQVWLIIVYIFFNSLREENALRINEIRKDKMLYKLGFSDCAVPQNYQIKSNYTLKIVKWLKQQ